MLAEANLDHLHGDTHTQDSCLLQRQDGKRQRLWPYGPNTASTTATTSLQSLFSLCAFPQPTLCLDHRSLHDLHFWPIATQAPPHPRTAPSRANKGRPLHHKVPVQQGRIPADPISSRKTAPHTHRVPCHAAMPLGAPPPAMPLSSLGIFPALSWCRLAHTHHFASSTAAHGHSSAIAGPAALSASLPRSARAALPLAAPRYC